jgi:predicted nucleic acid-binding protein
MIVVSNTTPLIGMAMLGHYRMLQSIFAEIHLPQAVYREIAIAGKGEPGASETEQGIQAGWIHLHRVRPSKLLQSLKTDLHEGEAEAIALASSLQANLILLDDRKARVKAQALSLSVTGTMGILLIAQQSGLNLNMQDELDKLRQHGFHISEQLYQKVIRL